MADQVTEKKVTTTVEVPLDRVVRDWMREHARVLFVAHAETVETLVVVDGEESDIATADVLRFKFTERSTETEQVEEDHEGSTYGSAA